MELFKDLTPVYWWKASIRNESLWFIIHTHKKDKWLTLPGPWELYAPPEPRAQLKSSCNSRPEPRWATAAVPRSARTSLSLRSLPSAGGWLGKKKRQHLYWNAMFFLKSLSDRVCVCMTYFIAPCIFPPREIKFHNHIYLMTRLCSTIVTAPCFSLNFRPSIQASSFPLALTVFPSPFIQWHYQVKRSIWASKICKHGRRILSLNLNVKFCGSKINGPGVTLMKIGGKLFLTRHSPLRLSLCNNALLLGDSL